jgi:hypothetical protein
MKRGAKPDRIWHVRQSDLCRSIGSHWNKPVSSPRMNQRGQPLRCPATVGAGVVTHDFSLRMHQRDESLACPVAVGAHCDGTSFMSPHVKQRRQLLPPRATLGPHWKNIV